MIYRRIEVKDAQAFWDFLNQLDEETPYMMYEPGERRKISDCQRLEADLVHNVISGQDYLCLAMDGDRIAGFIWGVRGKVKRTRHSLYLVVGVLKDYRGQGVGSRLFQEMEDWASGQGIRRLELTVECPNEAGKRLYEKRGFVVEGVKKDAMLVDGVFVDEYYMSKTIQ